jgi:hypothetical protein
MAKYVENVVEICSILLLKRNVHKLKKVQHEVRNVGTRADLYLSAEVAVFEVTAYYKAVCRRASLVAVFFRK